MTLSKDIYLVEFDVPRAEKCMWKFWENDAINGLFTIECT